MAVGTIYMLPENRLDWEAWSFANMAHHRDINRVLFERNGVRLDEYTLDPFDRENADAWLYQHWVMHQQFCQALGIAGYDLTDVDWDDPVSLSSWIGQHGNEHFQAGQLLNLG